MRHDPDAFLRASLLFTVPEPPLQAIHTRARLAAMRRRLQQYAFGAVVAVTIALSVGTAARPSPPPAVSTTPAPLPAPAPTIT